MKKINPKSLFLTLVAFLSLGVGNAWGVSIVKSGTTYIYLDRTNMSSWTEDGHIYLVWRYDDSAYRAKTSNINNTKLALWYGGTGWDNITHIGYMYGDWGDSNSDSWNNITKWAIDYTNSYNGSFSFNNGNLSVISATGSSKNWTLTPTYIGNSGFADMNKTITVKAKVSTDDGSSYSETTSPGTLSASSYKFTTYNSCASAQSLSSNTITCGYTATTTLTAQSTDPTGYTFVGWYNASGTQQTTSKTLTIYPTADATYYAYYKAKQTTITLNGNDGTGGSASVTGTYGQALPSFTNYTREGYKLDGYYTDASTGTKIINADGTLVANVSGYTDSSNKWARNNTTGITLYAHWLKTTVTGTMTPNPATANTSTTFTFNITFSNWVSGQRYIIINPAGGFLSGPTAISSNSVEWTSGALSYNAGTHVFKLRICNSTNTEAITDDYDINLAVSAATYTVTVNAGVGGSASPSSVSASPDTWSSNITATPNAGYQFVNWTSSGGGISINGATANPTQIKATSTGGTLTANFSAATYRVTLDNQSATTAGTEYVDATYNTTTLTTISKPTKTNYTFGGYYTATGGDGTQIIDANGNWLASKSGFTDDSKKSIITENKNLYAKWTETKYDVTVSCTNPTAGDFAMAGTYQVGNVTAVRLAAGAPNSGYKWGTWVLGDGVTLVSGSLTNSGEIYIKATKNSTVTFTYDENLESEWIVAGGDKIVTTGTTWRTTADANNKMLKKPGHSTESVVYFTVPVSAICEGKNNSNYQFKIYNTSTGNWYGLGADGSSYYLLKAEDGTEKSLNGDKNIELRAYILGDYEFKLDYSTATPKLTVTWPSVNQLQIYTANESSTGDAAIGNWSWDGTSGTISTKELTLQAKTQYKFKVIYNSDFYGFKTADNPTNPMTIANHTDWRLYDDGGNCYLYAPVTGTYTFRFNSNNSGNTTLTVDFPEASRIIYGVGALPGGGAVTVSPSFASEDYVLKTQAITFTRGDLVAGYAWKGWFNNAEGTGVALGTGATYTSAADTRANNTDFSVYACYDYATYSITLDQTGRATAGSQTSVTGTYNSAMPDISGAGKLPTAPDGYCFMGYYDALEPLGTKYYNSDGTSAHVWDKTVATTLYAYFKKAEITGITLNAGIFEPAEAEGEKVYVKADPIIAPTPGGTTTVCWELRYSNDNPIEGHAPIADTEGGTKLNQVKFELNGLAAGGYKIHAELRSGSDCAGTLLSSYDKSFSIANDHTVTIYYRLDTEDGPIIKASTTSPGKPLDLTEISAPTIVGYEFNRWKAGDGVTIDAENDSNGDGISEDNTIKYTAIYDGKLTAIYTKRRMIYFMNTLGWSGVTVYFYKNGSYWDNTNGTGSSHTDTYTNKPFSESKYGTMTQIEGTNIWYWDAAANGVNDTYTYVAFTEKTQYDFHFFSYQSGTTPNRVVRRGDYSPAMSMFVPLADQEGKSMNSGQAYYYNEGYWMNYSENTGYTLRIYDAWDANNATGAARTLTFPYSDDIKMPLKLDVDFNLTGEKWFLVYRHDGTLLGKSSTILTQTNRETIIENSNDKPKIQTSAPGIYTFTLTFHDDGENPKNYNYYINVDYPVGVGDYRVIYNDDDTWSQSTAHDENWWHPSDIIRKNTGSEEKSDTVSLFVSYGSTISAKFQYVSAINASTGVITWTDVTGGTIDLSGITEKGVYNFIVSQPAGGESIGLSKTEKYTGNYYIRTDCAGNTKWDSYRAQDHQMTYTEFSMSDANSFGDKFSHYFAHWCPAGTNVKFCVANDYSVCISDTLTQDVGDPFSNIDVYGNLKTDNNPDATANIYSANIRFMYNETTNKISRAYVSAASNKARQFLVLKGNNTMLNEDNSTLSGEGESAANHEAIFVDNENFIYERILKIIPGTRFKLYACYAKNPIDVTKAQYFRGAYDSGNFTTDDNSVVLLSGSGDAQKLRVIYDFKTNRLVAAWMPSDVAVSGVLKIDADVMILRDHQEAAECITFANGESKLDGVKTVYGAMKFNRWTLNNRARGKNGTEDNDKDHCDTPADITEYHPILDAGEQKSIYERSLYFISFPFDVKLSEVFGFGQYGTHWVIQYYDGLNRARNGYWLDSPPNWKYVSPAEVGQGYTLNAYQGYLLNINLNKMAYDDNTFWANNISNVELYFPSKTSMSSIKQTEVTIPALEEEYRCTINRGTAEGDRRIKDSFWRCIGVPSYNEFAGELKSGNSSGSTIAWQTSYNAFPFLYVWNMSDNTLTAQSTSNFSFQPMHAYLVQIQDAIYWNMVSATPASIVARRVAKEAESEYNWRLALSRDSLFEDQTYIRMSDIEQITDSFDFGQDLVKELNSRSNLYTYIGYEKVAANSMPIQTEQTTIVPLGLNIKTAGDYTFAMPEGTNGVGVTLVDTEANVRTSLSALDYTVSLEAGEYTGRFMLEISPVQNTPTDLGNVQGDNVQGTKARKVMIDGILYIVKDGKMYDARGARVE